jgi:uncharacterized alkaline shock family protein YloU
LNCRVENSLGSVRVSEDVVAAVAAAAASGVPGVRLVPGGIAGSIADVLGRKDPARGVRVEEAEGGLRLTLAVEALYGARIPEAAAALQEAVKSAVEGATGLRVAAVDVHVERLRFVEEKAEVTD